MQILTLCTSYNTHYCVGYRDAECGWVMVEEDEHNNEHYNSNKPTFLRTVLFLVIYAAKRGVLEVQYSCVCSIDTVTSALIVS